MTTLAASLTEQTTNSKPIKAQPVAYGIACMLLVFIGKVHELIPALQAMPVGKVVVALSVFLYFRSSRLKSTVSLFSFPQMRYYWGIVLLMFLSVPFGVWPGHSVDFIKGGLINSIVFFMLIAVTLQSQEDLLIVFYGYFGAIAVLTVASMLAWTMPRVAVGNTYDPNDLALLMVMALPVFIYALVEISGLKKIAVIVLIGLIVLTIIKTMSRGGFLGLLAVGAVIVAKEWKRNTGKILLGGIVIALFFSFFASNQFIDRMKSITSSEDDYNKTADYGRLAHWGRAITMIKEQPWLGHGVACTAEAAGKRFSYMSRYAWQTSHNCFLQIGVDLGVGGILFLFLIVTTSIRRLRSLRNLARSETKRWKRVLWWSHGLETGMYGYLVSAFFLSQAYFNTLYFYVAMSIVLEKIVRTDMRQVGLS